MDWLDYTFILLAYVVAASIKGLTGIGFSTSCLPIMALRLDLKVAIPLVIIPSIVSNLAVMIQAGRFRQALKRFWPMYAASVPGLWLGLSVLVAINAVTAKVILGLVLVAYAVWALFNMSFSLSKEWERNLKVPVGMITGFINGLTGSQVMPALPYLLSLNLHKNDFVQAINISFTLSSVVMLIGMNRLGYLPSSTCDARYREHCSGFGYGVLCRKAAEEAYGSNPPQAGVGVFTHNGFDPDPENPILIHFFCRAFFSVGHARF